MLAESPECKLYADLEGRHSLDDNSIPLSILPTTSKLETNNLYYIAFILL